MLEGVELPTLPTVGEIFSAKWVQAFREEASSVFSRLRMLRDLRSALTNAGFTSVSAPFFRLLFCIFACRCVMVVQLDSLTGEGLAASSFVAPHVRGAMKSCPAWKMSRERDALLLIGIYKHGCVALVPFFCLFSSTHTVDAQLAGVSRASWPKGRCDGV